MKGKRRWRHFRQSAGDSAGLQVRPELLRLGLIFRGAPLVDIKWTAQTVWPAERHTVRPAHRRWPVQWKIAHIRGQTLVKVFYFGDDLIQKLFPLLAWWQFKIIMHIPSKRLLHLLRSHE